MLLSSKQIPLYLNLSVFINCAESSKLSIESQSSLINCLSEITKKHFIFSRTVLVTHESWKLDLRYFSGIIRIDFSNLHLLKTIDEKFNHVILTYEDEYTLNETMIMLKNSHGFDSRSKYLIVAKKSQDLIFISNTLWNHRLYKSVMLLESKSVTDIYEVDFKGSNCGQEIQPIKIGYFDQTLKVQELFNPNMKYYFHNCPLKVIYSHASPWINHNATGVFVGVLNISAEINGFKLVYMPENPIYLEELKESYSFESVQKDFESGYADIFLGLGNNLPNVILETTTTVYDDNLYWAVPKALRMPYWKAMIHYFPYPFWLAILSFFIIICITFCLVARRSDDKNFKDIVRNVLNMFLIALNFPVSKIPFGRTLRTLITIYSWASLLTCVVLQARLYDIFSNPVYENDITDLEKLLDSGLPLKFSDGLAVIFLFTGPLNQRVFETYSPINLSLIESLDQLIITKDFATVVDTGVLVMRPNIREYVNIFDIAYFQVVFYVRKYHELFEILDASIKKIVESGFVNKLVSDVHWEYFLKSRSDVESGFFKLSLSHFQGAFMVLLYGLLLSSAIFFVELLYSFKVRNKFIFTP